MRKVPTLMRKVGGKVPVLEAFAINRAERFLAQGNRLVVPLVEMMYLFNGFNMIQKRKDLLQAFDSLIADCRPKLGSISGREYLEDNNGLWRLIRGSIVQGLFLCLFFLITFVYRSVS